MTNTELKIRELKAIKENKEIKGNMIKVIIMLIFSILFLFALTIDAKSQVSYESNPTLDKQFFALINDYRENMGVAPIQERNYDTACRNAVNNLIIDGKGIVTNINKEYKKSGGAYYSSYDLYELIKIVPSDFLLSNKFTSVAVAIKDGKYYISFARA